MKGLEKFIRNAAAVPLVEATPEDFPEEHPVTINQTLMRVESELHRQRDED